MTIRYHVDNMKCGHCVATVKQALEGLDGCEQASVDLDSASAEVTGDVDGTRLQQVLADLGYPASPAD